MYTACVSLRALHATACVRMYAAHWLTGVRSPNWQKESAAVPQAAPQLVDPTAWRSEVANAEARLAHRLCESQTLQCKGLTLVLELLRCPKLRLKFKVLEKKSV